MSEQPYPEALAFCIAQALSGKGEQRHGFGRPFVQQVWVDLARKHGVGFLTGQSEKKWIEANTFIIATDDARYCAEVAGAINYGLMALLWLREPDLRRHGDMGGNRLQLSAAIWLGSVWPKYEATYHSATRATPPSPAFNSDDKFTAFQVQMQVLMMAHALCERLARLPAVTSLPMCHSNDVYLQTS